MRHARQAVALLLFLFASSSFAAITGTVMTTDGAPLAGARVSIRPIESRTQRNERLVSTDPIPVPISVVQTDSKGVFSIPSPKEPVVDLQIEMKGYSVEGRRVERDDDLGAIALAKRSTHAGVIAAGGKPVANATVAIQWDNAEITVRTNEQGRYEAPDLKGAASITVLHHDYAVEQERFLSGAPPSSELNRTLSGGVSISGRIAAADGTTPVSGATVSVDGWPLAKSGDDGTFSISHAPAKWKLLTAQTATLTGRRAAGGKDVVVKMEKAASFSGRVTDARTKLPVVGAVVSLGPTPYTPEAIVPSTTTDAKGTWTLAAGPGTYRVSVSHPGFTGPSAEVMAASGQQISRDLALNPLARVAGVIVDEERRPVAAAAVATEDVREEPMMRRFSRQETKGMSGPDGRFALRAAYERDLRVVASKKGFPSAQSEGLRLSPGERKSGLVLTIPSGIAVSGRITDADGNPLSGVSVKTTETPAGSESMLMRAVVFGPGSDDDSEDVVRTASDGTFSTRVKEGTWDFTFSRDGFVTKTVRAQSVTTSGANPIEARLEPAVEITGRVVRGGVGVPDVSVFAMGSAEPAQTAADGSFAVSGLTPGVVRMVLRSESEFVNVQRSVTAPARDVMIELPVGVTLRGRVLEKGSSKPITSFQAGLATSRSGGGMMMTGPPQLRSFTSDDGSFTLEHVPPGSINVVASAPGYVGAHLNVEVQEGKDIDDLQLELETGVRLVGRITGPDGAPLSDATVMLTPSQGGGAMLRGMFPSTSTDAKGEYLLEGLAAGEEAVRIQHRKYESTSRTVTLKGKETRLDVQLSAGMRVTGSVVAEDGTPVADAEVSAMGPNGGDRTRTNASGAFEFQGLSQGRFRFAAAKSGYVNASIDDVDVTTSGPIRLTLKSGGSIYGHVTGVAANDMDSVIVTARSGSSSSSAPVDPQGNYRIEGAPTGTVRVSAMLRASATTKSSSIQTVELAPGSSQQVNIDFSGDITISGRVRRNGTTLPAANVMFTPRRSTSQTFAGTQTDEQGVYKISGLEPGDYDVRVVDTQRFSSHTTTYTVRGSATFDIDFKGATVRGRVVDASTREPIENATVQFRASNQGEMRFPQSNATTDPNGRFVLEYVSPGSYVITASRDDYGSQALELTIGDTGRDDLELSLSKSDGVVLKVIDARDGRPLTADAIVFDMQGRIMSGDTFRFNRSADQLRLSLAPGSYVASVSAFNYASRTVTLQSPSSPTIALTPGGTIVLQSRHSDRRRYRLLDSNGLPYPRNTALPIPRPLLPGSTTLEHIAPGAYTVQVVNDDESVAATEQVVVREGETATVDL